VGTAIGATFNENLNSQFVRLARHTFGVKRGFVSVDSLEGDQPPRHVARQGAEVLFEGPHDQEQWDVRWRQGQVDILKVVKTETEPAGRSLARAERELLVLLTRERNGRVAPMSLSVAPRKGDVAAVAIHRSKREEAMELLASMGWQILAPPSKVEEERTA
jgi:hypothetical protein